MSVITCASQLESIRDEWEKVFEESSVSSFFLSYQYICHWYECFCQPNQIRVYRIRDNDHTIGFLPLFLQTDKHTRMLKSLINDHCMHGGALVRKGSEKIFLKNVLAALNEDKGSWDVLHFGYTYSFATAEDIFPENLLGCLGNRWRKIVRPTYSFLLENYRFSAHMQKNYKASRSRLSKAGTFSYHCFAGRDALKYWPEFMEIEDSGWKGEQGSSIKRINANYHKFYEGFLGMLADSGLLRFFFLELNGQYISGLMGYFDDNSFHYQKGGYLEEHKALSPTNLLVANTIEHMKNNYTEIKRYHMFPSDYGYKHRYINESTSCSETIIYNQTFRGNFAYYTYIVKQQLRNIPGLYDLVQKIRKIQLP